MSSLINCIRKYICMYLQYRASYELALYTAIVSHTVLKYEQFMYYLGIAKNSKEY